ncbi:GNAT superfamily N-acetyltransferase [Nitrobacteraceae bacterium AZCC 2161]
MEVELANPDDLAEILTWLKQEYDEDGGEGFWCNRNIIARSLNGGDLYVIRDGGAPVAFQVGKHAADIVSVKKAYRRKGLGTSLFEASIARAIDDDVVVMQGECAPATSLPFWQKHGFERFLDLRAPDKVTVRRILSKALELPSAGRSVSVVVGFYPESSQYGQGNDVQPIAVHRIEGRSSATGRVHLPQRIVGLVDDEPCGADLAVRVEVDGKVVCFGKCKHNAARQIGVRSDRRGLAFFLDFVNSPNLPS